MTPDDTAERLEREAAFHDVAFAGDTRARAAKYYDVTAASNTAYREAILTRASGARILEYGCGTGSHAFDLARAGADVLGIDISPVAVDLAREHAASEGLDARFEIMDAENLELPDQSFDLICGTGILHHLDLDRSLAEIARVLKPGGRAVFSEPMGHNPLINLYRRRTPEMRTVDEHPLLMQDLEVVRRHFSVVRAEYFHLTGLAAVGLRGTPVFERAVRALDAVDQGLFRRMPRLRKYSWMMVLSMEAPRSAG